MGALAERTWLPRCGAACLLAVVVVLGAAPPAHATPGEASARSIMTDIALTPVETGVTQIIDTQLGVTSAPPNASESIPTASIQADLGPSTGGVSDVILLTSLESQSSSDGTGTAATASVGRVEIETPGGTLVITDVSASVSCPRWGGISAETTGPGSVTLNGDPVTLNASGTTVLDLSSGAGTFILTFTDGATSVDSGSAQATGFVIAIDEDLVDFLAAEGTITLAEVECGSLPMRATSGTIRTAETGAPLSDVCIVWSPVSDPGNNTVLWSNGFGTFDFETDEPGPINIGFFVPDSPWDCNGAIGSTRVPSWLDGHLLTGATGMAAVAPLGAASIIPGTAGIVACLGLSGPVAAADCVVPDVTLSGRVVRLNGNTVAACIFVLGDDGEAMGPYLSAPDGSWSAPTLPRFTQFAVAFLPYFDGEYGPCADGGGPPAPGPGELQPAFFGGIWIDFTDESLFEDPRGWGVARGATLVSGTTSGILGCLTDAPGSQVPRPECLDTLAATGTDRLPVIPIGLGLIGLGTVLFLLRRRIA